MKKIRLTKTNSEWNKIPVEEQKSVMGYTAAIPTVGQRFAVGSTTTSPVVEILSENTFRTHNSIYKWEVIQ